MTELGSDGSSQSNLFLKGILTLPHIRVFGVDAYEAVAAVEAGGGGFDL